MNRYMFDPLREAFVGQNRRGAHGEFSPSRQSGGSRSILAHWAIAAVTAGIFCAVFLVHARAADYPSTTVHIISPYSAGGGNDLSARIMADALQSHLGQPVVVENRTGATGMIGCNYVASSNADGYTLLWASADNLAMVPAFDANVPYKVPGSFSFVGKTAETGLAYVVSSKLPVKNMAEFLAYAKANPGKLHAGSAGIGGAPYLTTELFMRQTGIKMANISYRGISNAMTDLLAGRIEFVPLTPITVKAYVDSDKIRILGYSGSDRHPLIPDVPTISELGYPKATMKIWYSLVGPANMPEAVLARLRKAIDGALADPGLKTKFGTAGLVVAPLYGDDFKQEVVSEYEEWKSIAAETKKEGDTKN